MRLFRSLPALAALLGLGSAASGIEEPAHRSVVKEGDLEIRAYDGFSVAETPMGGEDRNGAFGRLFRYIEGGNAEGRKMAMTAPVLIDPGPERPGRMAFVAPAEFADRKLPEPSSTQVTTRRVAPSTFAVMRFAGGVRQGPPPDAASRLEAWAREQGWVPAGPPVTAYYNPPWTPSFLRRNELWIPVGRGSSRP